jgi:hypothetical protein
MAYRGESGGVSFHQRYLSLVDDIEREFRVAEWTCGDLAIWPLARMDLYNDMYDASASMGGNVAAAPSRRAAFPWRALATLATPVRNLWRSRGDLSHWVGRPVPAYATLLGDGVSMDRIDGAWNDRYGEPVMQALERRGLQTFCMQPGELLRLPWRRSTYAANLVALRGAVELRLHSASLQLPHYPEVQSLLRDRGVAAPSLNFKALNLRTRRVLATAAAFERILAKVRPVLAFVVTYYAGLGAAYLLACRRRGILSIDLQHCPHEGNHKAYAWQSLPRTGYAVLPAVFWNWSVADAADIRRWSDKLSAPWHRSIYGGHTQIADFLDDCNPRTITWDAQIRGVAGGRAYSREILVALQPIAGRRPWWEALTKQILAAPSQWRWWIRRHPASRACQDWEFGALLELQLDNVNVLEASSMPLPALLRHMNVLLSLASGAAGEAVAFGVPALFLSEEARGPFASLIDRGFARVIEVQAVNQTIEALDPVIVRPPLRAPDIDATLYELERHARDYAGLVARPDA